MTARALLKSVQAARIYILADTGHAGKCIQVSHWQDPYTIGGDAFFDLQVK